MKTILNALGEPIKTPQFFKDGTPIILNAREQMQANYMERHLKNDLGYEIPITTLTTIMKRISEQKYFEIFPADFFVVRAGEGAWSSKLTTYRSFNVAGEFEEGNINLGGDNARLASADAGVDALDINVYNWAKGIGWNIMGIQVAAKAGNWDLVTSKEKARKTNWDLGIQRVAFLGARGQNGIGGKCLGYLNQGSGITNNTTLITKPISSMTPAELKVFQKGVIEVYRENCKRTAWPDIFAIPESDYNGLTSQASPDFPLISTLEMLEKAFKVATRNKNFQILPLAYADAAYHTGVAGIEGKQVYTLSRMDEESLRMDVPVPYTPTTANSLDGFNLQNAAYGEYTGALAYRPAEMVYFTY